MNLADIQKAVLSFVLDSPQGKAHHRSQLNSDEDPKFSLRVRGGPFELEAGQNFDKSSGGSPRITSRRIVDVGSFPAQMIPAGENSESICIIPSRLLLVFGLRDVGTQPGTAISHLSNLVLLPHCDVGRGDSNVDHPARFLNGVREGDPLAPSKRQRMKAYSLPSSPPFSNPSVSPRSAKATPGHFLALPGPPASPISSYV